MSFSHISHTDSLTHILWPLHWQAARGRMEEREGKKQGEQTVKGSKRETRREERREEMRRKERGRRKRMTRSSKGLNLLRTHLDTHQSTTGSWGRMTGLLELGILPPCTPPDQCPLVPCTSHSQAAGSRCHMFLYYCSSL